MLHDHEKYLSALPRKIRVKSDSGGTNEQCSWGRGTFGTKPRYRARGVRLLVEGGVGLRGDSAKGTPGDKNGGVI